MNNLALADTAEFYRIDAAPKLDPLRRSALGQYMTPAPIGRFMASLFHDLTGDLRILDPGAGVGSLTAAIVERISDLPLKPDSVSLTCYEIEPLLLAYLNTTLEEAKAELSRFQIPSRSHLLAEDFILSHPYHRQRDIFDSRNQFEDTFTHVIMNPPYKKINTNSAHRAALHKAGLETSNLYSAFMFLAAQRLISGGELVAIVPRSFCNGPYFKPFRQSFFAQMSLQHIHVFSSRTQAFKGDEVLQENIILHAVKGAPRGRVTVTTSSGADFEKVDPDKFCITEDMTQRVLDYHQVIRPNDPESFVHIPTNALEQGIIDRISAFQATLATIGIEVSTGPVVHFRLREDLRTMPEPDTVPVLYASHFQSGRLEWPRKGKNPNSICISAKSRKWLWENRGHFVITRRFSAKEERRRIVASVYDSKLPGELVGFENHLNVFHDHQVGMDAALAAGLCIYLNSSLVDRYFRQFNGHTQVNATDLRSLRYPNRDVLERIGSQHGATNLSQKDIDNIINVEILHMPNDKDPLAAQQKIDDALAILTALGMPRGQRNERSALTLLALLDITPARTWNDISRPLMGITPIMEYTREHYGREYAPNTRETFRRQTMHQFVAAGIALYNPDRPDRPVNSPKACYQISEEASAVIRTFGTDVWQSTLETFLEGQVTLAAKWARHREMQMIPVQVKEGTQITLTPGLHSELIKSIITEFAPRFAPGAEVIYVGDTGNKGVYFLDQRLAELGVTVDEHGKMPDVVLYYGARNWLLLVESVTSHGPVDGKRHSELSALFGAAIPGLVYITAFPDRTIMGRYLGDISWETDVWCADAPSHLIHFNGERFLGPYD